MHTTAHGHMVAVQRCRVWAADLRKILASIEAGVFAETSVEASSLRSVIKHLDHAIESLVDLHGPDDDV